MGWIFQIFYIMISYHVTLPFSAEYDVTGFVGVLSMYLLLIGIEYFIYAIAFFFNWTF